MKFNNIILNESFPLNLDIYRFDTTVPSTALDDTSPKNLELLNDAGNRLVREQQEALDLVITKLLHP